MTHATKTPHRGGRTAADRTGFGRVYGAPSSYSPTFGEGEFCEVHRKSAGCSAGAPLPDQSTYPTATHTKPKTTMPPLSAPMNIATNPTINATPHQRGSTLAL